MFFEFQGKFRRHSAAPVDDARKPAARNSERRRRFVQQCTEQRLIQPNHPWTNSQVERINRTIKEATVKRYHYDSHDRFRSHLDCFLNAYNFARRLKALNGSTPHQYICNLYDSEENHRFHLDPPTIPRDRTPCNPPRRAGSSRPRGFCGGGRNAAVTKRC